MAASTVKIPSVGHVHPSIHLLGYEFGMFLHCGSQVTDNALVSDLPLPTLLLAVVGGLYLASYAVSYVRLLLELTVIPGISVSDPLP